MLITLVLLAALSDVKADIDAFARKALERLGTTPGMTVVVVKGNDVLYRGDFGRRDVEAKLPVTPDTRFYIASSTKAFLAMAAAILAEEGKLDLDAPVADVWPELKLTAPLDPKRLSLRDFLAMRPGVQNDTVNFRSGAIGNLDDAEMMRVLAVYSREQPRTFRYSNTSYILAAKIMERATKKRWPDLISETILAPLGMTATSTSIPENAPVAQAYRSTAPNAFERTREKTNDMMGPAGGMVMTSSDAAKWLIALINDGRAGGRQVLNKRAVQHVHSPQTTNKRRFRYFDRYAWGLGQDLADYEGDLLVHRFGGFGGAYSHISFMPEHDLGVAVFANGGGAAADAVAAYAYDLLLGKKDLDAKWSAELTKAAASIAEAREATRKAEARMGDRKPAARPLETYAGTYHYDRLGRIDMTIENGRLFAQLGWLRTEVVPTGGDEFLVDWSGEGEIETTKFVIEDGRVKQFDWGGRVFDRQ